jgi:hypothetical protein
MNVSSRVISIPRNLKPRNRGNASKSLGIPDAISSWRDFTLSILSQRSELPNSQFLLSFTSTFSQRIHPRRFPNQRLAVSFLQRLATQQRRNILEVTRKEALLAREIERLRLEVEALKSENRQLRNKLQAAHWRIDGERGEDFVLEHVGGTKQSSSARFDVLSANGTKLEVKCPNLNDAVATAITKRRVWPHILGTENKKKFDRLILVGPIDDRYRKHYADPDSRFIMFDIPFGDVPPLLSKNGEIQSSTAPPYLRSARMSKARRLLFEKYQVTRDDLRSRYNLKR